MVYQQSVAPMAVSKNIRQKFSFDEKENQQETMTVDEAIEEFFRIQHEGIRGVCDALEQFINYEYT